MLRGAEISKAGVDRSRLLFKVVQALIHVQTGNVQNRFKLGANFGRNGRYAALLPSLNWRTRPNAPTTEILQRTYGTGALCLQSRGPQEADSPGGGRTVGPSIQIPSIKVIVGRSGIPRSKRWICPTTASTAAAPCDAGTRSRPAQGRSASF